LILTLYSLLYKTNIKFECHAAQSSKNANERCSKLDNVLLCLQFLELVKLNNQSVLFQFVKNETVVNFIFIYLSTIITLIMVFPNE